MSVFDIKNYLEKIYNVPVLDVKTRIVAGKEYCFECFQVFELSFSGAYSPSTSDRQL